MLNRVERLMPQQNRNPVPDGNRRWVMVPRNDAGLVPRSADRIRQLHRHLVAILLSSKAFGDEDVPQPRQSRKGSLPAW
jgi:hypothetical protein